MAKSDRISPTAYATGYLWHQHGLSHPGLLPPEGKRVARGFRVVTLATRLLGGISLDDLMLARHKGIDAILARAIEGGRVGQVIEIAAGFSARGWRITQRFGERVNYLETDLPPMAAAKRTLLAQSKLAGPRHRVLELDALATSGPLSLDAVAGSLDRKVGTAIITEGLMNYLNPEAARGVWQRIATVLQRFPYGMYLCDAYFRGEHRSPGTIAFGAILQAFVRGRMHIHFESPDQAAALMRECGFAQAVLHTTQSLPETREHAQTPGGSRVRILEATR